MAYKCKSSKKKTATKKTIKKSKVAVKKKK